MQGFKINPDELAGHDTPLKVGVEGDDLVVRIGIKTLGWAGFQAPHRDSECPCALILDTRELAQDVAGELAREAEDGSSLVTNLLDEACKRAYEQGSLGLDYETEWDGE